MTQSTKPTSSVKRTAIKSLLISFVLAGLTFWGTYRFSGTWKEADRPSNTHSIGERTGTVIKFSHKQGDLRGLGNLVWDGQLDLGAQFVPGDTLEVWTFGIIDSARVRADVQKALRSGDRVVMFYREKSWTSLNERTAYQVYLVARPDSNGDLVTMSGEPVLLNADGEPVQRPTAQIGPTALPAPEARTT